MKTSVHLWFVLLMCCSSLYAADPYVTGEYHPVEQGYLVELAVHNSLADGFIWDFIVFTGDSLGQMGPDGWSAHSTYRDMRWSTSATEYMIGPGQNTGGFSFIAHSPQTTLSWLIHADGAEWGDYAGSVTPTPAPEPSTLLALGMGGFGILGAALRRRARA